MTVTSTGLTSAMQGLAQALEAPRRPGVPIGNWRWTIRQRLNDVRDALAAETAQGSEGWLAARERGQLHERTHLLNRLDALAPSVLESPDLEEVGASLRRLLHDLAHHLQRVHDLAYDEVELELGGSE